MLPFFLTIGIISGLIIGGVSLSCYLNKQGVFGKQKLISAQRYRAFEDEYVVEEESGDQLVGQLANNLQTEGKSERLRRNSE